ncbi:MAG TPA: cupin domain-containing protein [Pseudomonadales bacterium]
MSDVSSMIKELGLAAHPEGGWYRRIFQSSRQFVDADGCHRDICTAIIYLLAGRDYSAFHRIDADELWQLGRHSSAVRLIELDNGWRETLLDACNPVHCIAANTWFAACLAEPDDNAYAQLYCTVAPGFDFSRFQLAGYAELATAYPSLQQQIFPLCHPQHREIG